MADATGPDAAPETRSAEKAVRKTSIVPVLALVGVALLVLVTVALAVIWSVGRSRATHTGAAFDAGAFASAMRKAGVEATAPAAPVDLTEVQASGSHPFTATFTAEELSAVLNAFPYSADVMGTPIELSRVTVTLPGEGRVGISGRVTVNDSTYSGSVTGKATVEAGTMTVSGPVEASAEGIGVGGDRARQAADALAAYFTAYFAAAPGLTVESAQIASDGVRVTGQAPDRLVLP